MTHRSLVALCAAVSCATAQDVPPPASRPQDTAHTALLAELTAAGIRVDVAAKTITIAATVNQPADPIEYLLIHQRGKAHEALFVTEVKPSLLNAAFLALGLANGTNARTQPIEPAPTEAEIEQGAETFKVLPPVGHELDITVQWRGDDGAAHDVPVESLLVDLTTGKPVEGNAWVFLGGRMAPLYRGEPPVFVADFEGNLMSVCYLAPDNHLVTMRHERARDDQNWWIHESCPPPGTQVELRFKAKPASAPAPGATSQPTKDG